MAEPIYVDVRFEVLADDAIDAEDMVGNLLDESLLPEDFTVISVAAADAPEAEFDPDAI